MKTVPNTYRKVSFIIVCIGIIMSGCSTLKQVKLLKPEWFGMEQIGARVYVDRAVPADKRKALLDGYAEARSRVRAIYGSTLTDPVILGCTDRDCIKRFGGRGDGFAAYKATPSILLSLKIYGPGELAHEWSHIELAARIGNMKTIPMWFHEGLATIVGAIPRHSEAIYQEAVASAFPIPPLDDLRTIKQWDASFKKYPNPKGLNVVYATAGHEVGIWFDHVGQQGLIEFIEAMKSGGQFDEVYSRIYSRYPEHRQTGTVIDK
jgi:hypothetical protein